MSTARPLISLRKKRLALFVALAATAIASLCLGPMQKTKACAESPVPLRPLYIMSERVVVARAGQSTILQTEKVDDTYEQTLLRTSFYVSKTLKGEEENVVHIYQWLWGEDRAVPEDYAEGQTLLLFLSKRQDEDGYEVSSETYGAKKLSEDALKIYVRRIEELAKILSEETPDKEKIVEWLVRCVEEPATRWEGAYELATSQHFLKQQQENPSEEVAEAVSTEGVEEEEEAEVASASESTEAATVEESEGAEITALPSGSTGDDLSIYSGEAARLLTVEQKKRMADILFSIQKFTDEEILLFELVEAWGDDRLVPFIFSELEKMKDEPPYYAEQMITTLARKLQSDTLVKLAELYCEHAVYSDPDEAAENAGNGDGKEVDQEEKSLTGNSVQKRRARLQKFLAEAERVRGNLVAMAQ